MLDARPVPTRRPAGRLLSHARDELSGPALDGGQRLQVLDTLIDTLSTVYAHLPAKRAAYATDPVQALTLLRREATELSDLDFHRAVTTIVTSLRDAHTRYSHPHPRRPGEDHDPRYVAALPLLIEQYGEAPGIRYLVSKTGSAVEDPELVPGVTVLSWNGIAIDRAVKLYADRETGGRPDSRRARALESMTLRALDYGPPPDEDWVVVGFRTLAGQVHETRISWRVLDPGTAATAANPSARAMAKRAADRAAEDVRRAKKQLFSNDLWRSENRVARTAVSSSGVIPSTLQDVLSARVLTRRLGLLRIWSFDVDDDVAFVDEITRLVGLLPQTGLIVDLRGNPGGLVWAAERALQLFTDRTVSPTRFSLVASPATRQLAESAFNRLELQQWSSSLQTAVSTGEVYGRPLPLTDPAWCNDRGRVYPGPAVAVVDPNTYSSGDLFAAGWVDHAVGPLVSVGRATGGGSTLR